jgi:formate dehydrogenase alpha subunit
MRGNAMAATITITLDGVEAHGHSGMTILELARERGIKIPTLCNDPCLQSIGACRVCLVEDEKRGSFHAACVTPIAPGMVINTCSPRVIDYRKVVVKLMLASHPDSCLVCEKGNQCALRQIAANLGIGLVEYYPMSHFSGTQEVNPFILRDLSKCILCAKCIRADHELVVEGAIDYIARGFEARPATLADGPLEVSECTFCGTCVELCPTGALFEREKPHRGTATRRVATTCSFCGCGCSFWLEVSDNRVVGVRSGISGSANEVTLCVKGHYGYDLINHPDRLKKPLIREDNALVEASWDEAFRKAAQGLTDIKKKHGGKSIALLTGAHCTNEEAFLLKQFASDVLDTGRVQCTSSAYMSSLIRGMEEAVGFVGTSASIGDLEEADAILLVGANPTETAPIVGFSIKRGVRQKQTALIVIDPREIKLSHYARIWLRPFVCSDEMLLLAFLQLLLSSKQVKEVDAGKSGSNLEKLRERVTHFQLEGLEEKTGVSLERLKEAVDLFCSAEKRAIVFGNGVMQQSRGEDLVKLLCTIGSTASLQKKEETILFPLIKQSNALGCFQMGLKSDIPPEAIFKEILDGSIKGLWIVGEDPLLSLPGGKEIEGALKKLEFLIVSDAFLTGTGTHAHVVFPSATFAEKAGTITNLEGRLQRVVKAVDCVGESRPDWHIVSQVAERLGTPFPFTSAKEITGEIIKKNLLYSRMNLSKADDGYFCYRPPLFFSQEKTTWFAPEDVPLPQKATEDYPYTLIVGSILFHLGCGQLTIHSPRLCRMIQDEYVEINPANAAQEGIKEGDVIRLSSSTGEKRVFARLTGNVPEDVLFMPLPFTRDTTILPFYKEGTGAKTCRVTIERNTV